jgi:hypothetical protein
LAQYNADNREGKDFQGQRHPGLVAMPAGRGKKG